MKTLRLALLLILTLPLSMRADEARFFRISGPVASTITAFSADGYLTWTNAQTNATFTVQTTLSLLNVINWVDYIQVPATNPITIHRLYDPNPPTGMALIPAGIFTMGNCMATNEGSSGELPLHTANVSAFYMDRHEVTKALWDDVYQWATNHGYSFDNGGLGKATTHPVQMVSWYDATKWCNARSEKEGRLPAYYTSTEQSAVYRNGQIDVQNDWVKWNAGYRLPTEAEWEKAARGGVSGHRFPWVNADTITHSRANYSANSALYAYDVSPTQGHHPTFADGFPTYTSPVGYFVPNEYGLYDMAGNVFEWCWDWLGAYSGDFQMDPHGPAFDPFYFIRVFRGGSWDSTAISCRVAQREYGGPTGKRNDLGFRTALPMFQ